MLQEKAEVYFSFSEYLGVLLIESGEVVMLFQWQVGVSSEVASTPPTFGQSTFVSWCPFTTYLTYSMSISQYATWRALQIGADNNNNYNHNSNMTNFPETRKLFSMPTCCLVYKAVLTPYKIPYGLSSWCSASVIST